MKRRTVSCLLSVAAVLMYGSMAAAGPLPPVGTALGTPTGSLGPGALCDAAHAAAPGGGCGEADLAQATGDGLKTQINVDWMVLAPGSYSLAAWLGVGGETPGGGITTVGGTVCSTGDCYLYLYQEENSSVNEGIVDPSGPVTGVTSGVNMKAMSIFPTAPVAIAGVFGNNGDDTYSGSAGAAGNLFDDLDCGPGNPAFIGLNQALHGPGCLSAGVGLHPGHYAAAAGGTNGFFDLLDNGLAARIQTTNANPLHEEEGTCPAGDEFGDKGDSTLAAASPGAGGNSGPENGAGSGNCINPADPIETSFESGGITWTYLPSKPPHHETVTLFFASLVGPVYGSASTQATNATTWATLQTDPDNTGFLGEAVPVPGLAAIPEPTTLALFGGGLIALGLLRRKVKR